MNEDPYSKREVDIFFKGLEDKFDQLFKRLDKQDSTLGRIETNLGDFQTRISKLEDLVADYPEYKKTTDSIINYRWWIMGAAAAFLLLGGTTMLLIKSQLSNDIQGKISLGIDQAFNARFSKIQVINNN